MMKNIDIISEDILEEGHGETLLYHFTSMEGLREILRSDSLEGNSEPNRVDEYDLRQKGATSFISLSRSSNAFWGYPKAITLGALGKTGKVFGTKKTLAGSGNENTMKNRVRIEFDGLKAQRSLTTDYQVLPFDFFNIFRKANAKSGKLYLDNSSRVIEKPNGVKFADRGVKGPKWLGLDDKTMSAIKQQEARLYLYGKNKAVKDISQYISSIDVYVNSQNSNGTSPKTYMDLLAIQEFCQKLGIEDRLHIVGTEKEYESLAVKRRISNDVKKRMPNGENGGSTDINSLKVKSQDFLYSESHYWAFFTYCFCLFVLDKEAEEFKSGRLNLVSESFSPKEYWAQFRADFRFCSNIFNKIISYLQKDSPTEKKERDKLVGEMKAAWEIFDYDKLVDRINSNLRDGFFFCKPMMKKLKETIQKYWEKYMGQSKKVDIRAVIPIVKSLLHLGVPKTVGKGANKSPKSVVKASKANMKKKAEASADDNNTLFESLSKNVSRALNEAKENKKDNFFYF